MARKRAKEQRLKTQALKQITALIVITMGIALGLFYFILQRKMVEEQVSSARESLSNTIAYLETYIDEVDAIANNANYNYYMQNYLTNALEQDKGYMVTSENMREYEMSSQAFSDTLLTRTDVSSIMVFGKKSLLLYKTLYNYRNVIQDYSKLDWYKKAVDNPERAVITGPNKHAFLDSNNEKTISLSRMIQSSQDGSFLGVILIDFNLNRIEDICESNQGNISGFLCLINEDGQLVYQQKKGVSACNLNNSEYLDQLNQGIQESKEPNFRMRLAGTEYLISSSYMEKTGWTVLNIIPYSSVLADLQGTSMAIVAAVLSTLAITLAALNGILSGMIRPLNRLQRHMARVTLENMNQQVKVETTDEIGKLAENFNEMLDRIENLKEQVVAEQEDKRKYELQALQAQINPHFLYNTLDSIIWMAETEDKNIVPMTEALAKLFRISLNKGKEEITVKKEIEHVKNYLIIQSMRYQDKFTYEILVEPEVEKCMVLKLILQPIVENCIYHGIKKKKGSGHIRIEAYQEKEELKLLVKDDGCGMSEEICRKILSDEIEPENISGSGIGVKNVNERIQLRFGKKYGLHYESVEGKGTTVEYTLPYIMMEGLS